MSVADSSLIYVHCLKISHSISSKREPLYFSSFWLFFSYFSFRTFYYFAFFSILFFSCVYFPPTEGAVFIFRYYSIYTLRGTRQLVKRKLVAGQKWGWGHVTNFRRPHTHTLLSKLNLDETKRIIFRSIEKRRTLKWVYISFLSLLFFCTSSIRKTHDKQTFQGNEIFLRTILSWENQLNKSN